MGKLSIGKYVILCILGGEIAYTVCMLYGNWLNGRAAELHLSLFQLLPGYTGLNFNSWILGAITIAIWAGIGGSYVAWMHNASLRKN